MGNEYRLGKMRLYRKRGFYENYVKRVLDIICSLLAILVFGWLYVIIAILVRVKLGSPVIFRQPRPGLVDPKTGKERIFDMYKFRTMSDKRDEKGELLPDEERLEHFGRRLRGSSLDEIMEAFNILKGDMSIVGPRPQLVRDMVFMSDKQRMRHTARPGLTGLAQINGRNAVTWEQKIEWDLKYIEHVSFMNDFKILCRTVYKVFGRSESSNEIEVTLDYGDWQLRNGQVSKTEYEALQAHARDLIKEHEST